MSGAVEIELTPSDEERLLAPVESRPLIPKHTVFLSHSGAQKNFVEQLCEDLERSKHSPFFDKRPDSLPKGEVFAQYIIQAAQQCELAVVVVSEEYFSRSKWPMVELSAFVHSSKCKILPLFFGLSSKEFGDPERRERWFQTWEAWAVGDPRIHVQEWKVALREVDRRNGLEYVEALGEVGFRKDVVATVSAIMQKNLDEQDIERILPKVLVEGPMIIIKVVGGLIMYLIVFVLFGLFFFKIVVPIFESFVLPNGFRNVGN